MQQRDMEAMLRNISQKSGNANAQQTVKQLQAALNTPEGRKAAQKMMQSYGNSLENAARMAQSGNMEGAKQSMQRLMGTPEGAQLAAQIAKLMGR